MKMMLRVGSRGGIHSVTGIHWNKAGWTHPYRSAAQWAKKKNIDDDYDDYYAVFAVDYLVHLFQ